MYIKLRSTKKHSFFYIVFLLTFFFTNTNLNAQCAGSSNTIEVCSIADPSSQAVNLFSALGSGAVAGGTWNDDLLSGGLNTTTGILNAQAIGNSGTYTYTYTVNGIPGCTNNSQTITVHVGAYAGVPGPNGTECGDSTSYNLFQLFNGSAGNLGPQFNGIWTNVTTGQGVSGSSINPSSYNVIVGTTYEFSYIVTPPLGSTCLPSEVRAFLTIFPPAEPGTGQNLAICETDDMSGLTNLDLYSLLSGEDSGGRWTENSGTNEIGFPADSFINVQNIFNTFGPGEYTFTYTVMPSNPICPIEREQVKIIIERRLDFTGATFVVNSDICQSQLATATFNAVLTQGIQHIPNGNYTVVYQVSGQSPVTLYNVAFNGGVMSFLISSLNFQQVGAYTVSIINIDFANSLGSCDNIIGPLNDILNVYPTPTLTNASLIVADVCQNNTATAQLSGASGLIDGNYTIVYNLSGANLTSQSMTISVSGGVASFPIPGNLLPNAGSTSVTITSITNQLSNCSNTVSLGSLPFTVKPLPSVSGLGVAVGNACANQQISVSITGLGTLTNVTINYDLTGANTSVGNIIVLPVTAGSTSFILPQSAVPNTGTTTIAITNLSNTDNGCGVPVNGVSDFFDINPLPTAPVANDQTFCKTDNATVAQLVPNGNSYKWYGSATATTTLNPSDVLVSGNYYISQVNTLTGCESTRTLVVVTIDELQTPTLNPDGENFCGLNNPTLQELSANANSNGTLIWFDGATNGNQLPNTTLLQEGVTYYGFDFSTVTNCYSVNGLPVTVSLSNCDVPVDFFIPDGFSPNGDGVNETFNIPNIEFVYPNYSLEIFNRYGSTMYKGDKNKPDWNGNNGEASGVINGVAPNGVYFYIINFNKDNKSPKQGRLYLNR